MGRAAQSCCASIVLREKFAAAACVHALQAAVAKALEQLYAGWQLAAAGSASFGCPGRTCAKLYGVSTGRECKS